ncbi:hypothetical protein D3C78_1182270 [compost metagenome]
MPLLFAPAGQKTVDADGIDHRAREDVRTDFRAFFQNDDRELGLHLLQADRGGETRRTRANDHNVEFHRFAFGQFHRFRHLVLSYRRSHPAVVIFVFRRPPHSPRPMKIPSAAGHSLLPVFAKRNSFVELL